MATEFNLAAAVRRTIPPGGGSELPHVMRGDEPGRDWQGYPRLTAAELVRPRPLSIVESASIWKEFQVLDRTVRVFKPGQRRVINYVQYPLELSGADTLTQGLHASSALGYVDLPKGIWMLNTPIVAAEGTSVGFVYQDAALGFAYDPSGSVGTAGGGGLSSTPAAVGTVAVAVADTQILAANAARRRYVITNADAANAVWLSWGSTPAVASQGFRLGPGDVLSVNGNDPNDADLVVQELRGWAVGGAVNLGTQTWS